MTTTWARLTEFLKLLASLLVLFLGCMFLLLLVLFALEVLPLLELFALLGATLFLLLLVVLTILFAHLLAARLFRGSHQQVGLLVNHIFAARLGHRSGRRLDILELVVVGGDDGERIVRWVELSRLDKDNQVHQPESQQNLKRKVRQVYRQDSSKHLPRVSCWETMCRLLRQT